MLRLPLYVASGISGISEVNKEIIKKRNKEMIIGNERKYWTKCSLFVAYMCYYIKAVNIWKQTKIRDCGEARNTTVTVTAYQD